MLPMKRTLVLNVVGHPAEAMGKELSETQQHRAGKAMHYQGW